jgi:hypothetical protein
VPGHRRPHCAGSAPRRPGSGWRRRRPPLTANLQSTAAMKDEVYLLKLPMPVWHCLLAHPQCLHRQAHTALTFRRRIDQYTKLRPRLAGPGSRPLSVDNVRARPPPFLSPLRTGQERSGQNRSRGNWQPSPARMITDHEGLSTAPARNGARMSAVDSRRVLKDPLVILQFLCSSAIYSTLWGVSPISYTCREK